MRPRLVLLVLDGFALRYCTPDIAPHLTALVREGGAAPGGGRAVLPSSTYPNHASLATGVEPVRHGVYASNTFTAAGIRPAHEVGARGPTFLDAARAMGLSTGVVVGDPNILGVVGAGRSAAHWPPGGVLPPGTPTLHGYAVDAAPFAALLEMLDAGADALLCQLDNVDGLAHRYGPDSPEASAAYSGADARVGELLDRLRSGRRWHETIIAIVSDHGQITADLSLPPIDLPAAFGRAGIGAEVIEEGSAALIRTREISEAERLLDGIDGIAGHFPFAPGILYVHARRGRGFSTHKQMQRGIHGCPETTETICVATGGHPALTPVADAFAAAPPTSATVPRIVAAAVGLSFPEPP
jgi:hypothetical protein